MPEIEPLNAVPRARAAGADSGPWPAWVPVAGAGPVLLAVVPWGVAVAAVPLEVWPDVGEAARAHRVRAVAGPARPPEAWDAGAQEAAPVLLVGAWVGQPPGVLGRPPVAVA